MQSYKKIRQMATWCFLIICEKIACLPVRMSPINVKTAKPIRAFFVGPNMTTGKVYG